MNEQTPLIRTRLSIAYFLQFAIWGSWAVFLGGFVGGKLHFTASQNAWLYSVIPLGAIISPLFIGPIADKYFSAQKVMALLHLIGGGCLVGAYYTQDFTVLLTLMFIYGICYMPTIALINSVVFKHIPNPDNAPRVFLFGTIGWIVINVAISAHFGGMEEPTFFMIGGGAAILLAILSLTLPDTPPKGAEAGGGSAFGLDALTLFKDKTFSIFVICAFLASIPACGFFFAVQGQVLGERGFPYPGGLGTLCQIAEIAFMAALPFFVSRFGLKKVLLIGMSAWAVRYLFFMSPNLGMVIIALLLHGFCYSFLYVGSYMYGDKKAPEHMKASVQSLLTFLLLGVGMFLGSQLAGVMGDMNPAAITTMEVASADDPVGLPAWEDPTVADSKIKFLNPVVAYKSLLGVVGLGGEEAAATEEDDTIGDMSAFAKEGTTSVSIADIDQEIVAGDITYTPEEIKSIFTDVATFTKTELKPGDEGFDDAAAKLAGDDLTLTRENWLNAQVKGWKNIFLYPSIFIFVILAIFLVLGKDPVDEEEAPADDAPADDDAAEEAPAEEAAADDAGE